MFSGYLGNVCGYDSENMDKLGLALRSASIFLLEIFKVAFSSPL